MPTLPPHGSMIADRAGRRRARHLRWNINGLKKKNKAARAARRFTARLIDIVGLIKESWRSCASPPRKMIDPHGIQTYYAADRAEP